MSDLQPRYDLLAYWMWDARIVGSGQSPADDRHAVIMQGLVLPTRVNLVFPMEDARKQADPKLLKRFMGIPSLDMTRIGVHIKLRETRDDYVQGINN